MLWQKRLFFAAATELVLILFACGPSRAPQASHASGKWKESYPQSDDVNAGEIAYVLSVEAGGDTAIRPRLAITCSSDHELGGYFNAGTLLSYSESSESNLTGQMGLSSCSDVRYQFDGDAEDGSCWHFSKRDNQTVFIPAVVGSGIFTRHFAVDFVERLAHAQTLRITYDGELHDRFGKPVILPSAPGSVGSMGPQTVTFSVRGFADYITHLKAQCPNR